MKQNNAQYESREGPFKFRNSEFKIQHSKFRIHNSEFGSQRKLIFLRFFNSKFRIRNSEFRIRKSRKDNPRAFPPLFNHVIWHAIWHAVKDGWGFRCKYNYFIVLKQFNASKGSVNVVYSIYRHCVIVKSYIYTTTRII